MRSIVAPPIYNKGVSQQNLIRHHFLWKRGHHLMISRTESKKLLGMLIEEVEDSELASIGTVVCKIIKITNNDDATAIELKRVVESDPPLSAKLLRRANSAQHGLSRNITSIQEAIFYMGFNVVKEMAINLKMSDAFKDKKVTNGYSRSELWKHSLGVAICAKNIYRKEYSEKGDAIYAIGLLHDLGIIVEEQYAADRFFEITSKTIDENISLVEAEKELQGFDHCHVAHELFRSWKLPKDIVAVIEHLHHPMSAAPIYAKQIHTLLVADYLCSKFEIGYIEPGILDENNFERSCMLMKLDPVALEIITEDVIEELATMEEIKGI